MANDDDAKITSISLPKECSIDKWLVKTGSSVREGEAIAILAYVYAGSDKKKSEKLFSPCNGFISLKLSDKKAQQSGDGDTYLVATVEACTHPAVLGSLCAVCGMKIDEAFSQQQSTQDGSDNSVGGAYMRTIGSSGYRNGAKSNGSGNSQILTVNGGVSLSVSAQEVQRLADQSRQRLHSARKLSLVLDLDHTLVHATSDPRAARFLNGSDVYALNLAAFQFQTSRLIMKMRPNLCYFFEHLSDHYEISVYTAGTREYALRVADLICRHIVGAKDDEHMIRLQHSVRILDQKVRDMKLDENDIKGNGGDMKLGWNKSGGSAVLQQKSQGDHADIASSNDVVDKSEQRIDIEVVKTDDASSPPRDGGDNRDSKKETEPKQAEKSEEMHEPLRKRVKFDEAPIRNDLLTRYEDAKKELDNAEKQLGDAHALNRKIFGSRIISRTDVGDLGRDVKDLRRAFPCGGTMSSVVDDREDVWANAKNNLSGRPGEPPHNLLLVRPYHWGAFIGFADVNNASGVDLSLSSNESEGAAKDETDMQLQWTANTLRLLYDEYYRYYDKGETRSVPDILCEMRKKVFGERSTVLLFSGLVPLHKQQIHYDTSKPRPAYVRYAQELGAMVITDIDKKVTHVIAAREGTDKVHWASRQQNCHVVRASWLMECFWSLTRVDEDKHMLKISHSSKTLNTTTLSSFRKEKDDSDSDSSDDDDFAAELEEEMLK